MGFRFDRQLQLIVDLLRLRLRDGKQWRLEDLLVGELDGAPGAELLAVYERVDDGVTPADATPMRAYDLLPFARPAAK